MSGEPKALILELQPCLEADGRFRRARVRQQNKYLERCLDNYE